MFFFRHFLRSVHKTPKTVPKQTDYQEIKSFGWDACKVVSLSITGAFAIAFAMDYVTWKYAWPRYQRFAENSKKKE